MSTPTKSIIKKEKEDIREDIEDIEPRKTIVMNKMPQLSDSLLVIDGVLTSKALPSDINLILSPPKPKPV